MTSIAFVIAFSLFLDVNSHCFHCALFRPGDCMIPYF